MRRLDRESRQTNGNNIFRWYKAGWGRYTQSDPIGVGGGTPNGLNNLFVYAENQPINRRDPRGLYSVDPNCDSKTCGPPTVNQCYNNPRATICLERPLQDMRDQAIRNKDCRQALLDNGVDPNAFARSLSKNTTKYPIINCDPSWCGISGGNAKYFPLGRFIPLCSNLFGGKDFKQAAQSLFHEFLHDFKILDGSGELDNIMSTCYPGYVP